MESFRKLKIHIKGDERILGDSDFVAAVLEEQNERLERYYRLRAKGFDFDKVVKRAAAIFELKPEEILSAGKQRLRVRARSVLCYWAVKELGMSGTSVAKLLNIGQPAVSRAVGKGENLVAEMNLKLISSRKV